MIFYSHGREVHFYKQSLPLSLTVKVRVSGSRKWPKTRHIIRKNNKAIILTYYQFGINKFVRRRRRAVDERATDVPSLQYIFNMWTVSSDVSIQRRHWQPLSVHLWAYCTRPPHDVNDVMCEGWPQHRGMSLQRQHFLLIYLKTLSVGPAWVRTRDLPLSRPALSQMSQPDGGK